MVGPTDAPANDAENWFPGQMLIARTWSRWVEALLAFHMKVKVPLGF